MSHDDYYIKYLKYKNKYIELKGSISINNVDDEIYYSKYKTEKKLFGGVLGTDNYPIVFGFWGHTTKSVWWYIRNYKCTYKEILEKIPDKVNAITHADFERTNREHSQQQITVADLKKRGFPIDFLKNAGFSVKELIDCGFNARDLINGIKHLTLEHQINLIGNVDVVKKQWLLDNPNIILVDDMKISPSVKVKDKCGYKKLISTKKFNKGDNVYSISLMKIKHSNIIIYKLNSKYHIINNITHTINRGDYRLFYYFDIFINHSCSPNIGYNNDEIFEFYDKKNNNDNPILYNAIANIEINIGDELTCDYTTFDKMNDGKKFECNCGSKNCKKII